jgi:diguanylate cyclase (GGDEF)-like protein
VTEHIVTKRAVAAVEGRLLLVDHSKAAALVLSGALREAFHMPIDHATSLAQTEQLIAAQGEKGSETAYAAAIVEASFPGAENADAIDACCAAGIPTIALTAAMDDLVYQRVAFRPIVDYIDKTVSTAPQSLVRVVRNLWRNSQRHVLLVDDSQVFCEYLMPILRQQTLRVSVATTAAQARDIMANHHDIALLVIDHEMPGMTGVDFCAELRATSPLGELGIVGMTGSADPFVPVRFLKAGADDILRKPFLSEEFTSRINACLDHLDTVRRMHDQAHRDFLTELYNRRHLFAAGIGLHANAMRKNLTLSVAMIDVDYFKRVNDRYGHDAGDQVLVALASILTASFRTGDLIARMGGEEFCVLTVNAADPRALMERLRDRVENALVQIGGDDAPPLRFTVSVGYTTTLGKDLAAMINEADQALYQAKQTGRNRVVLAG